MILKSDVLQHWKVRRLIEQLGAEAFVCLQRLWIHAETRKRWRWPKMQVDELESIADWRGKASQLAEKLVELRLLDRVDGRGFSVHGWAEHNQHLVSAWRNGRLGGRPKKNRPVSDGLPASNRPQTEAEPSQHIPSGPSTSQLGPSPPVSAATPSSHAGDAPDALKKDGGTDELRRILDGIRTGRTDGLPMPDAHQLRRFLDQNQRFQAMPEKLKAKVVRKYSERFANGRDRVGTLIGQPVQHFEAYAMSAWENHRKGK